jgi:hypothetical protein
MFQFYCGNLDCPTRRSGSLRTFQVANPPDGKVWICPDCRSSTEAVAWPAQHPCPCGMVNDHFNSVTPTATRPEVPS